MRRQTRTSGAWFTPSRHYERQMALRSADGTVLSGACRLLLGGRRSATNWARKVKKLSSVTVSLCSERLRVFIYACLEIAITCGGFHDGKVSGKISGSSSPRLTSPEAGPISGGIFLSNRIPTCTLIFSLRTASQVFSVQGRGPIKKHSSRRLQER